MYLAALGRPPRTDEVDLALAFLEQAGSETSADAWADLAHVLFNLKEFIFVR
jgi:hypothetical protein